MDENYKIEFDFKDKSLKEEGFSEPGIDKLNEIIKEYGETLYEKSISIGDSEKSSSEKREITSNMVQGAAHKMASLFGKPKKASINIQLGQLLLGFAIGVSGNHLFKADYSLNAIALIPFVACVVAAGFLYYIEKSNQ